MRRGLILVIVAVLALTAVTPLPAAAAGYDTGPARVYFSQTGHYLAGGFLDYWHLNGDLTAFGYPITDEFQQNGLTVQYFERAVFEYNPSAPPADRIQLRLLGQLAKPQAQHAYYVDQNRREYMASVLLMGIETSDPFAPIAPVAENGDQTYFSDTGHSLSGPFKNYWEMWGGLTVFGFPISEAFVDPDSGLQVQYFERAVLEWHPAAPALQQVELRRLGSDAAARDGVSTTPEARDPNVPEYSPGLWQRNLSVNPADVRTPPPGAPFGKPKWIEVDLSQQALRAWQGRTMVFSTAISTGLDPNPTPPGFFQVYEKLPLDEMTNGPKPPPGETLYDLKNVPNVMYFLAGGYAIHGAYWHWDFGQRVSHGCVNLPLDAAAWMYNWTPLGTTVWIHN